MAYIDFFLIPTAFEARHGYINESTPCMRTFTDTQKAFVLQVHRPMVFDKLLQALVDGKLDATGYHAGMRWYLMLLRWEPPTT